VSKNNEYGRILTNPFVNKSVIDIMRNKMILSFENFTNQPELFFKMCTKVPKEKLI